MSTTYPHVSTFALPREEAAAPDFDERLAEAAVRLLAGGDVGFKLSTRVGAALLPRWKLAAYSLLCRRLPASLRVPPAPAMQRGFYHDWHAALEACKTADDQLLVMTVGRAKASDSWDLPVECRPKDETDKLRTRTLKCVFGPLPARADPALVIEAKLPELESRLTLAEQRLAALEEAKGTRCAPGHPV